MTDDPNKNAKRLVLLFWGVLAFYYFTISWNYISNELRDDRMEEYIQKIVQLAGNETRTPREIRSLVMAKASELSLPVEPEQIKVLGSGHSLKISLDYEVTVTTPFLAIGLFSRHYEHNIGYREMHF